MLKATRHKPLPGVSLLLKIRLDRRLTKKALMKGSLRAGQGLVACGLGLGRGVQGEIRRFSHLVVSVRFRAAKTGGNRFDRLISLEESVQPVSVVWGRFRYGVGGRN
jgi:hypothetical protein